jgi:hypothetical protein
MRTDDMAAFDEAFRRANEMIRTRSQELLSSVGDNLRASVENGSLLLGVDRGYSRQFLTEVNGDRVLEVTGADLRSAIRLTRTLHLIELPCLLAVIVLSFWAWGWYGLLAIPGAYLLFTLGVRSNLTRDGGFSIALAILAGIVVLFSQTDAVFYWALSLATVGIVQRLRYSVPNRAVRKAAMSSPEFTRIAIDAGVVILKSPEDH